jgi:YihY family inner membrane protein
MPDFFAPVKAVDKFQQRHRLPGFMVGVIKKYGDDQGGYQAALLTYYGFLALFPLLLVLTTLVQMFLQGDSQLRQTIIHGATNYIPIIGSQLQQNVHNVGGHGVALVLGLLTLIYGLRGVADAFRNTVNHAWEVPREKRSGFLPATARSFGIIAGGGIGFLAAAIISAYATAAGHHYGLRVILFVISAAVLFVSLLFIIKLALNRPVKMRQLWPGAAVATVGLLIIQAIGGFLITHQLKRLNNLYGTFAVVLGLLFLLYLEAQILVYSLEIDAVRGLKRWPRHLF